MSNYPAARQAYIELRELSARTDLTDYFERVREYATAPSRQGEFAIPGLFGAFAAEIERRAKRPRKKVFETTDYFKSLVERSEFTLAVDATRQLIKRRVPSPSLEFGRALVGDLETRDRLNGSFGMRGGFHFAAAAINRGRHTMGAVGLGLLPLTSEVLRLHGVSDEEQRGRLIKPAGFDLIMGLSLSESRFKWHSEKMDTLLAQNGGSGGGDKPTPPEWVLYDSSVARGSLASNVKVFEPRDGAMRLRWGTSHTINTGCPMTFLRETIFRPAWDDLVDYGLAQGFEP